MLIIINLPVCGIFINTHLLLLIIIIIAVIERRVL